MKKVLVAALAVALLAVMTAPAFSSEFSVSGEFKVQAWNSMDADFDSDVDDDEAYFSQRFRVSPAFKVSDALSAHLRMDVAEGTWGKDYSDWNGWANFKENYTDKNDNEVAYKDSTVEVDRAYMVLDKGNYSITVGQHFNGAGPNYILWDQQTTGVTVNYSLDDISLKFNYSKMDEGDLTVAAKTGTNVLVDDLHEDVDFYGANLGYTMDSISANVTFAMRNDSSDADVSPWALGLQASMESGAFALNGELDYFGGSHGNDDVVGTQLFVDASMGMDAVKAGSKFMYAMGTDDAGEVQYSSINDGAGTFDPMGFDGAIDWEFYPLGYASSAFSMGGNSGIMAINPYVEYTVNEALKVYANVGYAVPQDDDLTTLDSGMSFAVSADYVWLENLTFSGGFGYAQPDFEDNTPDDPNMVMLGQLKLDF